MSLWCLLLLGHSYEPDPQNREVSCRRCGKVNHALTIQRLKLEQEVYDLAGKHGMPGSWVDEKISEVWD